MVKYAPRITPYDPPRNTPYQIGEGRYVSLAFLSMVERLHLDLLPIIGLILIVKECLSTPSPTILPTKAFLPSVISLEVSLPPPIYSLETFLSLLIISF